jgi:diketogulonate reductase-like aldo/keto reductase
MKIVHSNGADIPALGFGTWPMRGEVCVRSVTDGLQLGYRHIDTAQGYGNEAEVGEGIAASGVKRDAIFITTKVRPEWTSTALMPKSVEASLKKLRTDRVDLLLAHWPNPAIPVAETVTALSEMKRRGLTRHIGVSNYTVALLDEAVRRSPEPIVTHQFEYHPYADQTRILAATRGHGLAVTAYCPIALGRVVGDPVIERIGQGHGRSAVQVTLRWLLQQDRLIAIPKSSRRERLKENLDVFDFELSSGEMAELSALRRPGFHLINEPAWVAKWD